MNTAEHFATERVHRGRQDAWWVCQSDRCIFYTVCWALHALIIQQTILFCHSTSEASLDYNKSKIYNKLKYNDSSAWQQFCLLILMRCSLTVLHLLLLWLPVSSFKNLHKDGTIVMKLVLSLKAMSNRSSQYAFHNRPDRCTHNNSSWNLH